MRILPVKLEGGLMPTKSTEGSAAYDLYAPEGGAVYPQDILKVSLGIRMSIPAWYCGILTHRSSMNQKDIHAYGLIDSDYRGIIMVTLMNMGSHVYRFNIGDRIAQIRFARVPDINMVEVSYMSLETERGEGGHGSTGQ